MNMNTSTDSTTTTISNRTSFIVGSSHLFRSASWITPCDCAKACCVHCSRPPNAIISIKVISYSGELVVTHFVWPSRNESGCNEKLRVQSALQV
jgi:hypothetical protein